MCAVWASACTGALDPTTGLRGIPTPPANPTAAPERTLAGLETVSPATAIPSPTAWPGREWAHVVRVWDGNTVLIAGGLTVRYVGVESPGAGMFSRRLEPFGRQAAERNVVLVEGKDVEIEADVDDVDGNGFLLRYVYVDGAMVNAILLREGLAKVSSQNSNRKYGETLELAEAAARAIPLNVWTLPTATPVPTVTPTDTPTVTPTDTPTVQAPPSAVIGTIGGQSSATPTLSATRPLTGAPTRTPTRTATPGRGSFRDD